VLDALDVLLNMYKCNAAASDKQAAKAAVSD
jgi:hypothetical protein